MHAEAAGHCSQVGSIENEYRVFDMEILAGEPNLETEVRQHKARFRLNYGEVYWNSRLEQEHRRLTDSFHKGQVCCCTVTGLCLAHGEACQSSQLERRERRPTSGGHRD